MKLSAQEEYGLRCLVQLGRRGREASLTLTELGRLEGLSTANVAKMMRLLRKGGFVDSVRGQAGGYRLALPPSRIRIGDVLASLGGRLYDSDFCRRGVGPQASLCQHAGDCSVRPVWELLQEALDLALGSLTLEDLAGGGVPIPSPIPRAHKPVDVLGAH